MNNNSNNNKPKTLFGKEIVYTDFSDFLNTPNSDTESPIILGELTYQWALDVMCEMYGHPIDEETVRWGNGVLRKAYGEDGKYHWILIKILPKEE